MKKVATPSERLVEIMRIFDISQSEMCRRTGLTKSSLSLMVSGKRNMGRKVLERISQSFGVYAEWLMGYDCPMNKSAAVECSMEGEDESIKRIIRYYAMLNDRDKIIVESMINEMVKNEGRKEKE